VLGTGFALRDYGFEEIGNPALRPVKKRRTLRRQRGRASA
jgi:hypothetical protein